MIKKVYALLLALCLFGTSFATEKQLLPFSDWEREYTNRLANKGELSYALTRCGALQSVIGIYFVANTASGEAADGKRLVDMGRVLSNVGAVLAREVGLSTEALSSRHSGLMKIYVDAVKLNKSVNNNIFYDWVGADFEFCNRNFASLVQ